MAILRLLNAAKSVIDKEPELVSDFVAAAIQAQKTVLTEPDCPRDLLTMNPADLKAALVHLCDDL